MGDDHWALNLFTDMSSTSLEPSEEEYVSDQLQDLNHIDADRAECHGDVMPDAPAWLIRDKMQEILKM
jgi:hypothetical protein